MTEIAEKSESPAVHVDVRSSGMLTGLVIGLLASGLGVLALLWAYRRGMLSGVDVSQLVPPVQLPLVPAVPAIAQSPLDVVFGEAFVKDDKIVPLAKQKRPQINTPPREYTNPIAASFLLPAPGQEAIRVASTADRPYVVQIRPVDPPGAFAILSFSSSELNVRGATVPIPVGDTIIIPVGQWQSIPMAPNSALYARGNVAAPRVTLSVSGAPVGG